MGGTLLPRGIWDKVWEKKGVHTKNGELCFVFDGNSAGFLSRMSLVFLTKSCDINNGWTKLLNWSIFKTQYCKQYKYHEKMTFTEQQ